ncbi:MAG: hypothetical protein QF879_13885 [Candidatus Latescibacteria bacterium]|nr:hypothetical protein [Candidatus Latescibacterota bacterium]
MAWMKLRPLIGLDGGTGAVKVVQMHERAGRKFVVSASKVDIEASTDDDCVRTAINKAMKMAEVRGKRAWRSIAGPATAVRKLT